MIRPATAHDLPLVRDLWRAFCDEVPDHDWRDDDAEEELRELEQAVATGVVLLADDIGFVVATKRGKRVGFVDILYVRPEARRNGIAAELTRMIPVYECRQNVKPGITGWAQLHARKDEPVRDTLKEFEYDLYYVKNHAPSLYAFILLNGIKKASL